MENIVPSFRITTITNMEDSHIMEQRMVQLSELEEDRFITEFHQKVQKEKEKACHDRHIKKKKFKDGDLVFLYDGKFAKFLGNLQMHWLGLYIIREVIERRRIPTHQDEW